MHSEAWLKVVFVGAFAVAVVIAARTARAAARVHGAPVNQLSNEVRGLLVVRGCLGLVFYGALLLWLFPGQRFQWMYLPVPMHTRWAAALLLVPTLVLFGWAFHTLGTNYRGGVGLYDDHRLVTSGPYRAVRHPIYLSFILIMALVLVLSANWVLGVSGLLLVTSIAIMRMPIEERQLGERFGDDWHRYHERTGAVSPRFRARSAA